MEQVQTTANSDQPENKTPPIIISNQAYKSIFSYVRKTYKELYVSRYALFYFVRNALRYRYRRSNLGLLWNLLNPFLTMIVMGIAFALVFNRDVKVYLVYLFSGSAPYTFLNLAIQTATQSMVSYEPYLKKVNLPKPFFPLVNVSIELVNFVFMIIALYVIALIIGAKFSATVIFLPFAMLILYIFCLGVGMILSVAFVYFRDLSSIVSVGFTALFYFTPILYPEDLIPEQLATVFKYNPISYYVLLVRRLILGDRPTTLVDWGIPLVGALVVLFIGIFVMMKKDREIVYRL